MPTRNVVLTDNQDAMIDGLVGSGRYQNASEVLRDGLRLLEVRESREAARLEALKTAARIGFADLDEGRFEAVDEDNLGSYIAALGNRAVETIRQNGE